MAYPGIHMEERAVTLVRDTLRGNLANELALIDAEYADDVVTTKPTEALIIGGTRKYSGLENDILVEVYSAVSTLNKGHAFTEDRLESDCEIFVRLSHAGREGKEWDLQRQSMRAAAAVVRVLHLKGWELGEPYMADATWNSTRRTSGEDDYLVCKRVLSLRVGLQEIAAA